MITWPSTSEVPVPAYDLSIASRHPSHKSVRIHGEHSTLTYVMSRHNLHMKIFKEACSSHLNNTRLPLHVYASLSATGDSPTPSALLRKALLSRPTLRQARSPCSGSQEVSNLDEHPYEQSTLLTWYHTVPQNNPEEGGVSTPPVPLCSRNFQSGTTRTPP